MAERIWYEVTYVAALPHYIDSGSRAVDTGNSIVHEYDTASVAQIFADDFRKQAFAKDVKMFRHRETHERTEMIT